jgi:putative ABC transport system permease protein
MRVDDLRRDLRGGLRGLARTPGFTAAALVTLALGIGATSAIFTVVRAVLLQPLPYAEPERRVMLWSRWVSFDKTWLSDQEILDYRRLATSLTAVAGWASAQQNLTGDGEPQRVGVGLVTANTFEVLGARPALGRGLSADDDRPGAAPVAVLSDALWRVRYGADPSVLGRRVLLNDVPVEIVGVMPPGFRLPTDFTEEAAEPTELWRALQIDERQAERGNHGYFAAAVLAPGHSAATATDELRALTTSMTAQGLYHDAMQFSAFATSLDDEIRGGVRPALALLLGASLCLLLIACANVAGLLLVRGDARLREVAVRSAVGASSERLLRQFVTESVVLATGGAVLGLALALGALRVLAALDAAALPAMAPLRPDAAVLAVTLVVAIGTTLVCGALPAWRALRVNLVDALREGSTQATLGGARLRLRGALVVAEVALAVVLVVGAGLMARSLSALGRVPLGFSPDHVLTLRLALPQAAYPTPERVIAAYRRLLDDVRALPGVTAAGVVRVLPLATTIGDWGLRIDGYMPPPGQDPKGDWQIVSDGAFEAMGMRLVRGRWFTPADTTDSQPVMVVNETLARTYFPDGEAVGRRIRPGADGDRPWAIVVGIVADERHNGVTVASKEKFYVPHSQWHVLTGGPIRNAFVVVRTAGDPMALAGPVRSAVRRLDPNVPIANLRPMDEVVAVALATPRLTGFVLGAFAGAALVLAVVGLYGVLAYLVARRTHEIGIRMALGAARGQVLGLVLRHGVGLALAGLAAGLAAAAGATRLMRGLLYGVQPTDPATFATVAVALLIVAALASLVPASRAMRVSPVVALRTE